MLTSVQEEKRAQLEKYKYKPEEAVSTENDISQLGTS